MKERVLEVAPKATINRIQLSKMVVKSSALPSKPPQPVVVPPKKQIVKKRKQMKQEKKTKKVKTIESPVEKQRYKTKIKPMKKHTKEVSKNSKTAVSKVDTVTLKEKYISDIKRRIRQNLIYPKVAKRMRIEGVIILSFTVFVKGSIRNIKVVQGSNAILKKAAVKTLTTVVLKAIPVELNIEQLQLTLPIAFKLVKG